MDGDDAAVGVDEPDVGVRSKDLGERGVHVCADGSAEVFYGCEAAMDGDAGGVGVVKVWSRGRRDGVGGGEGGR